MNRDQVTKLILSDCVDCTRHSASLCMSRVTHCIDLFRNLDEICIHDYHQCRPQCFMRFPPVTSVVSPMLSQLLSCVCDPHSSSTSFTLTTSSDRYNHQLRLDVENCGIDKVRQSIEDTILKNNSLLSIPLDIRHYGRNILTAEDEATIQQHIENHRDTLRNDIKSLTFHTGNAVKRSTCQQMYVI
jgi:hypothetical protein